MAVILISQRDLSLLEGGILKSLPQWQDVWLLSPDPPEPLGQEPRAHLALWQLHPVPHWPDCLDGALHQGQALNSGPNTGHNGNTWFGYWSFGPVTLIMETEYSWQITSSGLWPGHSSGLGESFLKVCCHIRESATSLLVKYLGVKWSQRWRKFNW